MFTIHRKYAVLYTIKKTNVYTTKLLETDCTKYWIIQQVYLICEALSNYIKKSNIISAVLLIVEKMHITSNYIW